MNYIMTDIFGWFDDLRGFFFVFLLFFNKKKLALAFWIQQSTQAQSVVAYNSQKASLIV